MRGQIKEINPMTLIHPKAASHSTSEFVPSGPIDIISYAISACALGQVLVARSDKGVCAILIGDDPKLLIEDLAARFPKATLVTRETIVRDDVAKVVRFMDNPNEGLQLSLDMRGMPVQRRIWEKLRGISSGHTVSYTEMASCVGPLATARMVAEACAANPIALAIPCHRVVRSDGDLVGYRWGIERKRALIENEALA
ncbi:AraC family transcriptional regulator, regulatory protein of adaptative response / methylated-DNA-[protein]-cysteine methyltransferase [Rhizobiales bacterium GAS113]|nr:AraC family transcriptional regulator, regulatory protein of adaptative response / methylated-DNA-[protein]-cysteine methyltransferase [Rhizobiales bacterium GAS113]